MHQNVVDYQAQIYSSTQHQLISLIPNNANFSAGDANGFLFYSDNSSSSIIYQNGKQTQNIFGAESSYYAEVYKYQKKNINNMAVIIAEVDNHGNHHFLVGSMTFKTGAVTLHQIINGSEINVYGLTYVVYAAMMCGLNNDAIIINICEQGHFQYFYDFTQSGNSFQRFAYNNIIFPNSIRYIQIGYITNAKCDHQLYVLNVANTLLFTALKDTLNSLETVLSTLPGAFNKIAPQVANPYLFKGGITNSFISQSDGNTWLQVQGNYLINQLNTIGFQYSNDIIASDTNLGFTNWGRYFTHHTTDSSFFVSVLDLSPLSDNDYFKISFNLAQNAYNQCQTQTGIFIVNQATFAYQWQIHYNPCSSSSAPFLNTILIHPLNEVIDGSPTLFKQPFTFDCSLTNPFSQVASPKQRIYYIMYTQNCQINYTPPITTDSKSSSFIAQNLIQIFESSCDMSCYTCSGLASNQCSSCLPGNFRTLINNQCPCNSRYYDAGSYIQCQACHYSCLTCNSNTNTSCLTCSSQNYRLYSSSQCTCQFGYYDDGSSQDCKECSYTCSYTCTICSRSSTTTCFVCPTTRSLNGNSCPCNAGYFDNGSSATCVACSYTCATCSGSSTINCVTCPATRTLLNGNTCPCNAGYFDNGSTATCIACSYACLTCLTFQFCQSCDPSKQRFQASNQCLCSVGYYDDGFDSTCQTCNYTCFTCSASANNNCISCDASKLRTLSMNSCPCNENYYDDGSSTKCQPCHFSCQTCRSSGSLNCLTCQQSDHRVLQLASCTCQKGYYDDGSSKECKVCDYSCQTCEDSTKQCISCSVLRQIGGAQSRNCICPDSFFDDGQNMQCQACHYSCLTCSNVSANMCHTCASQSFRKIQINSCICIIGYYESDKICILCHYSCKQCLSSGRQSCLSCPNKGRVLIENQCKCDLGFFDDGNSAICQSCDKGCESCSGSTSSDCLSCYGSQQRALYDNRCICRLGYEEIDNICYIITLPDHQTADPLCQTINCIICKQGICQSCKTGFFLNNNSCQQCDSRCSQCHGPNANQCITCSFIEVETHCKLCSEVLGLQNFDEKCKNICGDGIVYKPSEQCDDGNLNEYDGCSSKCKITNLGRASLYFSTNQSTFNNTRTAVISFQSHYTTNDLKKWQFKIQNYNSSSYNLSYTFKANKIYIVIKFNESCKGQQLIVKASHISPLINRILHDRIPDFIMVSQGVQQATSDVLSVSQVFINLIAIIMGVALITGGLDMVWELLDLLQLFSYLKYLNVDYPYNVNSFFNYLSDFNYSFITNNIPFINDYTVPLNSAYDNSGLIKPSYKLDQDAYVSLFSYNFLGILFGWSTTILTYYLSKLILIYFKRWNNINDINNFEGFRRSLYLFRFKVSRLIVSIFFEFSEHFFYNGLLRTYLASEYALNFFLMMELRQTHFLSSDFVLSSSSWFALIILLIKLYLAYFILNKTINHQSVQLTQLQIKSKLGSVFDGLKMKLLGAKYFGLLDLIKKFLFMFSLIIFYDNPVYQVAGLILTSSITSSLFYIIVPNEEKYDFWKTFSCEFLLFFSTCLIFVYAVDKNIHFLSDNKKILIGWFIIACCVLTLLIQIAIDIKIHAGLIIKSIKRLKYIITRFQRLQIKKKNVKNSEIYDERVVEPMTAKYQQ